MLFKKLYLSTLLLILFVIPLSANARVVYVENYGDGTASLANAQSAYNAASNNDTIVFPACADGDCVWTSYLSIEKPVTIMGAADHGTKLTASGTLADGFFYINGFTVGESDLVRITGFEFNLVSFVAGSGITVENMSGNNIRVDNNIFHHGNGQIFFLHSMGLIDNNYFYNGNIDISFSAGDRAKQDASWADLTPGTVNALFIEDNHFILNGDYGATFTNENVGTFGGGKLVIRYNNFDSTDSPFGQDQQITPIMTHGSASGGGTAGGYWQIDPDLHRRGQALVEIYNNVMVGDRISYPITLRGSSNLVYNNSMTDDYFEAPKIYMREEEYGTYSNWPVMRVDYPAEDQVHNSFFWNNTMDGVPQSATSFVMSPDATAGIVKDRDFFEHAPCLSTDSYDAYGNECTHGKQVFECADGYDACNGASSSYPTDGTSPHIAFTSGSELPLVNDVLIGHTSEAYGAVTHIQSTYYERTFSTVTEVNVDTDTITLTALLSTAPIWAANEPIVLITTGTLPSPLTVETTYYIKNPSDYTTQLAATPGGDAIDLTTIGTGTRKVRGNTWELGTAYGYIGFSSQTGTFQAEDLDIQGGTENVMTIAGDSTIYPTYGTMRFVPDVDNVYLTYVPYGDYVVDRYYHPLQGMSAPTISSFIVDPSGAFIIMTGSETLLVTISTGLTLTSDGGAVTLTYASGSGTTGLVYSTSRTILSTETITYDYTQPGNGIEDASGNDLASISDGVVTNSSTQSGAVTSQTVYGVTGSTVFSGAGSTIYQ